MTYGTSVSRKSTRRVVRLGPVRTLDSPRAGGRLSEVAARRTSCCTEGKRGTALVSWGRRLPSLRIVSRPNRANDLRDLRVPEVNSPRRAARARFGRSTFQEAGAIFPKSRRAVPPAALGENEVRRLSPGEDGFRL